jgi:hypothetical protein
MLLSSLQTLGIGKYMIEDVDMVALMVSLTATNSTLQSFDMLSCGMTSTITGMALWEEGLPRMTILQRLAIPADAAQSILQGLVRNTSLQSLDLEDRVVVISARGGVEATSRRCRPNDLWLDLNRGGHRLLLRMTMDVPTGLWSLVLERAQHSSVVAEYYYGGPNQAMTVGWVLLRNRVLLEQQF